MGVVKDITKNKTVLIILLVFILFGFYLRSFNLDLPSIGYHNMKETEYLSPAKLQPQLNDYFRRPVYTRAGDITPFFEEYPQMPLITWMIQLFWLILGESFWAARIGIVLFSLATIPVMYSLVKKLTKSDYISLTSALLFSFMPVAVFYGRNIQPETPALFFLLLGITYFLDYIDSRTNKDAIKTGVALAFCGLLKPTFLIGLIPMASVFPFEKLKDKKYLAETIKHGVYTILPMLTIPIWMFISNLLNTKESLTEGTLGRIDLFRIFSSTYWTQFSSIIKSYLEENFTWFLIYLAVIGLVFLALNRKSKLAKFTLVYALAIIPYSMVLADYIKGHNYYQFPFVPVICLAVAYAIYTIGMFAKGLIKVPYIQFAALLILLIPIGAVQASTDRQFNMMFFGMDVAGDFINKNSQPGEHIWRSNHVQYNGVCYLADRMCEGPIPKDYNRTIRLDREKNFQWLFIQSPDGLAKLQQQTLAWPKIWEYFQNNYRVRLVGLGPQTQNGQPIPTIFVLQKGGNFSLNSINPAEFSQREHKYTTTNGVVNMIILERP